jgi:uncharacterized protein YndB with AHSA1/START domain
MKRSRKSSLKIRKTIQASRAKVFRAWSDTKIAKTWSCPEGCELTLFKSNPKVGGKYQLTMKTPFGPMSASGV